MAEYFQVPATSKISEDQMTVKYDSGNSGEGAAFGVIRINPKDKVRKYKWKFRINIIDKSMFIDFGLVQSDYKDDGSFYDEDVYCAIESSAGPFAAYTRNIGSVSTDEDDDIIVGQLNDCDIVKLELDLERQRLHLSVNQKRHCEYIRTKLEDNKEYKLAVCLDERASVTMLHF